MHAKIKHFFLLYCIITLNIPILNAYETKKALVEFQKNNLYLNVKVADTKESRIKGLMHIKKLDAYSGMLFVFPENKHASIWMKNTLLSLDIIFISKKGVIVDFVKNALPMTEKIHSSKKKVKYVLEINSGMIERYNINVGDKIKIEY
tara:strand:- start:60 stop:503 length:444 start_codon:yes stop_codon:yes gene_type:complete